MLNNFDEWLNELENEQSIQIDEDRKKRIEDRVMRKIHNQESSKKSQLYYSMKPIEGDHSRKAQHRKSFLRSAKYAALIRKIAVICIIIAGSLSISIVGYATIGHIVGVFKLTPELEKQIDRDNPVIPALETPDIEKEVLNKYENTNILDENSFSDPELYGPVTDVELQFKNMSYSISDIAFGTNNIAVLTREKGLAWSLKSGEQLTLTISIDVDFAATESSGEDIGFAYVYNSKYYEDQIQKVTDRPTTYIFTAPEDGEYYLCIENMSATYIKIMDLEIS